MPQQVIFLSSLSGTQSNTNPFIIRSQQRRSDRGGQTERKRDTI